MIKLVVPLCVVMLPLACVPPGPSPSSGTSSSSSSGAVSLAVTSGASATSALMGSSAALSSSTGHPPSGSGATSATESSSSGAEESSGAPPPASSGAADSSSAEVTASSAEGTASSLAGQSCSEAAPLSSSSSVVVPVTYGTANRSIMSGGVNRNFVLATPNPFPAAAPALVFSLHGDGGSGNGMRNAMPMESHAAGAAVFVYPSAPGGTFEYYTYDGRTREAQFVLDVVALLQGELGIDPARVFITGFSGGATMANALGCRLGPAVRGLGIHSGTLYPVDDDNGMPDFTYTGSGGVDCVLPASILVWGKADNNASVGYTQGQGVRDNYRATLDCANTSTAVPPPPCVTYDACDAPLSWCPVDNLGHAVWSGAGGAIWGFFSSL